MRRQYFVAAVPAAALILAPLLPFLRTTDRWLGLPPRPEASPLGSGVRGEGGAQ